MVHVVNAGTALALRTCRRGECRAVFYNFECLRKFGQHADTLKAQHIAGYQRIRVVTPNGPILLLHYRDTLAGTIRSRNLSAKLVDAKYGLPASGDRNDYHKTSRRFFD